MKCNVPSCLGHADERTAEVICTRCQSQRWTLVRPASAPDPDAFLCHRCRVLLAGGNVVDPLVTLTPAKLEALSRARAARHPALASIPSEKEAPIPAKATQ